MMGYFFISFPIHLNILFTVFAVPTNVSLRKSGDTMRPVRSVCCNCWSPFDGRNHVQSKRRKKLHKGHEIMIHYQCSYFTDKTTNLVFQNELIFIQLDELDELDKKSSKHEITASRKCRKHSSVMVRVTDRITNT